VTPTASTQCYVCRKPIDMGDRFVVVFEHPLRVKNDDTFSNIIVASPSTPKRELSVHSSCLSRKYKRYGELPTITNARTQTHVCPNCRKNIHSGDRLFLNLISLGRSLFHIAQDVLEISLEFEYCHVDCDNPGLYQTPRKTAISHDLSPHVFNDYTCTKCRKPFQKDDKIIPVVITAGKAYDPTNPVIPGLSIVREIEFAHANCQDPKLEKVLDVAEERFPGDIQSFHGTPASEE